MKPAEKDPWATDTADPARIFREMFPSPAPRLDWRMTGREAVAKLHEKGIRKP